MQKKSNHLALFAKFWEPGKVKTRLGAKIGDTAACDVYRVFVNTLLRRFDQTADDRTIVFTPADRQEEFKAIAKEHWTLHLQTKGGLGQKLTEFVKAAFDAHDDQANVVIIGSDCLDLDDHIIEQAFLALNEADVVLGPTHDGGYYLIGLSGYHPEVFAGIAWSTESVYEQTTCRIHENDLSLIALPILNDIDEAEDLDLLVMRLESQINPNESSTSLLAAVKAATPQS